MLITKDHFTGALLAYTVGIGSGLLLCAGMQKLINNHERSQCNSPPPHHVLVEGQSFLGDTVMCIEKRDIAASKIKRY